jgi:hypothetical protein
LRNDKYPHESALVKRAGTDSRVRRREKLNDHLIASDLRETQSACELPYNSASLALPVRILAIRTLSRTKIVRSAETCPLQRNAEINVVPM